MKSLTITICLLALPLLAATPAQAAPPRCELDIVGTWESVAAAGDATRYRFDADGSVRTLARRDGEWREVADSKFGYRLDDPRAPTTIEFVRKGVSPNRSIEIVQYDRDSFTTKDAADERTRWVRVDPRRYFVVFAGRGGSISTGGSAFAMLIRSAGGDIQVGAFGFYVADDLPVIGPIPDVLRAKYMNDSPLDTDVMLRVELTAAEFERSLEVLHTWERRAREGAMLYEVPYLNGIVYLEQMAQSLRACDDRFQVHKLDWTVQDTVVAKRNLPQLGFYYLKELQKLNGTLHVVDQEFDRRMRTAGIESCARCQRSGGYLPLTDPGTGNAGGKPNGSRTASAK